MNERCLPLLRVENLVKYYPVKEGLLQKTVAQVKAVDDISFSIARGSTLGLVGESGCGKTTAGRAVLRLSAATAGKVFFDGIDVFSLGAGQLRKLRPLMQIIFQDPYSSLSPRLNVGEIIGEAVREHGLTDRAGHRAYIEKIMDDCGLQKQHINRYPHEFSGGQRQRICIARALALKPRFIVADEPVSALDVSIQAQIINLLKDLQNEYGLTYLFISHDLSVVEHISSDVAVMYLGSIVEQAGRREIFERPLHPYTQALLSAVPVADPQARRERLVLQGDIPSPANPPSGCKFHTRCPRRADICKTEIPPLKDCGNGHFAACHFCQFGKINEKYRD